MTNRTHALIGVFALSAFSLATSGCVAEYIAEQREREALDNYRAQMQAIDTERLDLQDENEVATLVFQQRLRRLEGRASLVAVERDQTMARIEADRQRWASIENTIWTVGGTFLGGGGALAFMLGRVRKATAEGEQSWMDTVWTWTDAVEEAREKFPEFDALFKGEPGELIKSRLAVRDPEAQTEITAARKARKAGA